MQVSAGCLQDFLAILAAGAVDGPSVVQLRTQARCCRFDDDGTRAAEALRALAEAIVLEPEDERLRSR